MLALAIEFTGVPGSSDPPVFRSFAHGRRRRFGGHSGGETPGPIPNPEVKPSSADGTALETGWESRSPPRLVAERAALEAALRVSADVPESGRPSAPEPDCRVAPAPGPGRREPAER